MTATRTCSLIASLTQTKKTTRQNQKKRAFVSSLSFERFIKSSVTMVTTVTGANSLHCLTCRSPHGHHLFSFCCCCLFLCVDPINGGWTDWFPWLPCSVSCGRGIQISVRFCTKPYPARGGKYCVGPSVKKQICNPQHCPCKYCALWWLSKYIYPSLKREKQPNCEEKIEALSSGGSRGEPPTLPHPTLPLSPHAHHSVL